MSFSLAGFVFFGTICSYNFHWFLTPPVQHTSVKLRWHVSMKTVHLIFYIVGIIGSVIFSLKLIEHWFWIGITGFLTFLYSAPKIPHPFFAKLKKIALGKTIFLAFAWAHVTALFPLVINLKTIDPAQIVYVINRTFLIYAICIIFDYRDVEEDRRDGIRSLITLLDEKGIDRIFWVSIAIFDITLAYLFFTFDVLTITALFIPGIIVALLYYPSKRNFSDYLYYFVLDGLMMLSAPLLLLFKFAR
ncbi:MAG: UbiA family prenyltransferase [Flavisolibacter sp.]